MIKINIFAVGSIKEKFFKDGIDEYIKRLSKFCEIKIIEIKEQKIQGLGENITKDKEGEDLLQKIKQNDYLVLMDLHGREYTSEEFSQNLSNLIDLGRSPINIAIGGSLGFSEKVINRANSRICFSKMTFPHQMARLILVEQIYRAFKIINNEAYHH